MKALQFDNGVRIIDTPRPNPPKGEALIRVLMAGICNTDIELARGYMNFRGIPGHEFVGIVEQSDDTTLLGKRVVGEINCVCPACNFCKRNMPHHCADRTVLGILGRAGAFAEYVSGEELGKLLRRELVPAKTHGRVIRKTMLLIHNSGKWYRPR